MLIEQKATLTAQVCTSETFQGQLEPRMYVFGLEQTNKADLLQTKSLRMIEI